MKIKKTKSQHASTHLLDEETVDLDQIDFSSEILSILPTNLVRKYGVLPIAFDEHSLTVAPRDSLNAQTAHDLRFACQKEIRTVKAPVDQVEILIKKYYDHAPLNRTYKNHIEKVKEPPVVEYVNKILEHAVKNRSSDIHFEPFENEFKIRYRVDGVLHDIPSPPQHLATAIISRLKVMAHLNIAEQRSPQDGRFQTEFEHHPIDFRVSTLPTQHGESLVLRILDRNVMNLTLEQLGMSDFVYERVRSLLHKPNGIFIVTGPTGSGKTTTIYSCLNKLNSSSIKILTAEDPIEYELDGIQQISINEDIGLTFAHLLRSFLRHDPDKMLVGEIRDFETAQMAIQASLTGHLVLTSLHTNDSTGAITRLTDMGVESFLISATLEAVLAQRLVRKICPSCKTIYHPNLSLLTQLDLERENVFYHGQGCEHCMNTGYRGRFGIYELLEMNDVIRQLIHQKTSSVKIRQKAVEMGMTTLREDGIRRSLDGLTTLQEILKYT